MSDSTTTYGSWTRVTDPLSNNYIKQGQILANIGLYVSQMQTDKEKNLGKRCQNGIDQSLYEGTAKADGTLEFQGVIWDWTALAAAMGATK